jgi:hypothetical protein
MLHRRIFAAGAATSIGLFLSAQPATAWGPEGHALIGKIADQLVSGTRAGGQVSAKLGTYTLEDAAKWPDCVRSVHKDTSGQFKFTPDKFTAPCTAFETPDEQTRMEDYARRNWDTFPNRGKPDHEAYHFADIPIQHGSYSPSDIGANDHDVVHAINAAIAELTGQTVPPPFSIKDDKEAILLLAHFVGDIHQPLHVGAIYLDAQGHEVEPHSPSEVEAENTAGGNLIEIATHQELHGEWDAISKALAQTDISVLVSKARAMSTNLNAPITDWAAVWASESVAAAGKAYSGITYTSVGPHQWRATFSDRSKYVQTQEDEQQTRVIQAGARLAALFHAIWP